MEDGKIAEVRQRSNAEAIDLGGNYLAPGFIDLHIHGALGRDTMEASPEAFQAICDYHATGGTTSLLLTTVTAPIPKIVDVLRAVRGSAAPNSSKLRACTSRGLSSRESAARRATRGIHPRSGCRRSVDQLLEFADVIRRVTLAPELPGRSKLIDRLREQKYRGQRRSQRCLGRGGARAVSSTGCGMSRTPSIACHRASAERAFIGRPACSNSR